MRRGLVVTTAVAVAAMPAAPAMGAVDATRNAQKLVKSFTLKKDRAARAAFAVLPPDSNPAAVSSTRMAGFPRVGKRFAIISNGNALFAPRRNLSQSTSFVTNGPWIRGTRDLLILRVKVRAPRHRNCLEFDFKFLSEEFPEFVDSEFNDGFLAELNKSNWWSASNDDPNIHHDPRNFAVDSEGNPIRVNRIGGTNSVKRRYARGTTYDAATRVLRASVRLPRPGRHRLFLSIFDQGDRGYDSSVFLDNLRLRTRSTCTNGVSVAP